MTRARLILVSLLGLAVLLTSVGVVYAKYSSRRYFVLLEVLRAEQDALGVEWGQLQLEQSTWATHQRVERIARDDLQMHIPSSDEVMVIRP